MNKSNPEKIHKCNSESVILKLHQSWEVFWSTMLCISLMKGEMLCSKMRLEAGHTYFSAGNLQGAHKSSLRKMISFRHLPEQRRQIWSCRQASRISSAPTPLLSHCWLLNREHEAMHELLLSGSPEHTGWCGPGPKGSLPLANTSRVLGSNCHSQRSSLGCTSQSDLNKHQLMAHLYLLQVVNWGPGDD